MQESGLRLRLAIVLFLGNFFDVMLVLLLTGSGGFTQDQQKMLLLVIGPMTAPSMMSGARYFLKKERANSVLMEVATTGEKVFGLGPVILLPTLIGIIVLAKAFNIFVRDFKSLITDIAVLEGIFGRMMALITQRFFGAKE